MHAFVLLLLTVADPELGAEQPVDAPRVVRSAGMEAALRSPPFPVVRSSSFAVSGAVRQICG